MSRIVRATLVKRVTADGLMEMHDHVAVGTVYQVDLDSLAEIPLLNTVTGVRHRKRMVQDVLGGWLPVELLAYE